ncbi:MAG: hypothetical protein VYE14_06150, partial [Verrucomicrobiota bacterium]|nr:hypothetical protein [Verrucomicrobiota bacterium]
LRTAHPDSGNAMRKFILQFYPETTRMQEQRDNERDRYRSFFARRLPENARPPAMRVEDDGERSRGREVAFRLSPVDPTAGAVSARSIR